MSQSHWLWEALTGAGIYALMQKSVKELARFKMLSLDDVGSCLQQPDEQLVNQLLDPNDLDALHIQERVGNYRRMQRARLNDLREHYSRKLHNATLFGNWAKTEQFDIITHELECSPEVNAGLRELDDKSSEFRTACRLALYKIAFWSMIRFDEIAISPVPNLVQFRTSRGLDIPNAYQTLKLVFVKVISQGHSSEITRAYAEELGVAT
jgi:hypothetical protein